MCIFALRQCADYACASYVGALTRKEACHSYPTVTPLGCSIMAVS